MRIISLIVFIGSLVLTFAQPTCQLKHSHLDNIPDPMYQRGLENLRSDTVDVLHYEVNLDFTEALSSIIKGSCEVKFEALMDINTISLDLLQLTIDSIVYDGNQISYSYNDTLIVADFGGTISTGSVDSLTVYYNGSPQIDPSGWGGFYMSGGYYYNLGVGFESIPHNYGRVWHPCFDNFVERATYSFEILTNNNDQAYCNGTRTNVQTVGTDSLLTSWNLNTAIPTYLASVAVSDYTHVEQNYFSSLQSTNIPIWLAAHENDTTNLKNSFINLNGALEAYETYYGPYVWERVGYVLVTFNAGAMEHATNIAYPKITVNGNVTFETLMAHELSHHWWGDWVTCETAEEMWINEGMAVYSEHTFTEFVYGFDAYKEAVRNNHYDVLHRAHVDDSGHYALNAVPLTYTYGEHSYRKGADVMHTLRGYMGDANFIAGLQAIQSNFGGGNISSAEFRDELNNLAGVDVTDFFNDWIFSPGFSQFAVVDFSSAPSSSLYDVEVEISQKLKASPAYHTNVPFTLTFMDNDWNVHEEQVMLSGPDQTLNFTIPIDPVFVTLNMDEKINHAVTAETIVITSTGNVNAPHANAGFNFDIVLDSAMLRVEHNWVAPNTVSINQSIMVSQDRYWTVHGVDIFNLNGTMQFDYNAQNNNQGDLDNSILKDWGAETFIEDSIVLLYRPNEQSNWDEHPNYFLNIGNATDKKGTASTNVFMPGQYTFGYKTSAASNTELSKEEKTYKIYPNPADDSMNIDLSKWKSGLYTVDFYEISGKYIENHQVKGGKINTLSIDHLNTGMYLIILSDGQGQRIGSKRVLVN